MAVALFPAGAGIGWLYWDWNREQAAITALRATGGEVEMERIGPEGLRRWVPVRWEYLFDRASKVTFYGGIVSDYADPAAVDWPSLHRLRSLRLWRCRFRGAVITRLSSLRQLEELDLAWSKLNPDAAAGLAELSALHTLHLTGTNITDADLVYVGHLEQLRKLSLHETSVGDAGLAHLARLTRLESMDLMKTDVTDAGLIHLHSLSALREVYLYLTGVTPDGSRRLKISLPNADVIAP